MIQRAPAHTFGRGMAIPRPLMPTWVTALPLWQWYGIPNTALSSIAPAITPTGGTGPSSKISDWAGACLKRTGSVYIIGAAGGHADYSGNEVDAIVLNTETPAWVELRAPTPDAYVINTAPLYLDYRPAASHTYMATQFIDQLNRFVIVAPPGLLGPWPAPPAGWPLANDHSPCFNLVTNDWEAPTYIGTYNGGGEFIAALTVKHQMTGDIYMARLYSYWYKWTRSTNTWSNLGPAGGYDTNYVGAAIDPVRNRILMVGGGNFDPRVKDLTGTTVAATFGGLGIAPLNNGSYSGMVYDEVNDNFLSFQNTTSIIDFYRVDAATFYVDKPTTTGTPPAVRPGGVNNAMQYVPELGGVVIANSYGGNVQFMRTSLTPSTLALAA
jgi:hypothetical protein